MASTDASSLASTEGASPATVDLKREVVTVPVADIDRTKRFYESLGWRLGADITAGDDLRVVQFPPGREWED
jgi:predicted enzyme related to lactoylglutathione lyase